MRCLLRVLVIGYDLFLVAQLCALILALPWIYQVLPPEYLRADGTGNDYFTIPLGILEITMFAIGIGSTIVALTRSLDEYP